jgi:hypothetical protein
LSIGQRPITVTADAESKVYGDSDPVLTYQVTVGNLVNSDGFSGSLTRAAGEDVGSYAIRQGTLAASANYTLSFQGNDLAITPATLTVTANHQSKVCGDVDPGLTYLVSGLKLNDTESRVLSGFLARAEGENVGNYQIGKGTLAANANYTLSFQDSDLEITSATPTATKVQRFGYHNMATTVVLTFTGTLDQAMAEDVRNYRVVGPGGHRIAVCRAVYDAANRTVTLHFAERLSLHHPYRLTVAWAGPQGVRNTPQERLPSQHGGKPGSGFQVELTGRDLVLDHVSREFLSRYHILPKASQTKGESGRPRPETHATKLVVHSSGLFTRLPSFPALRRRARS